MKNKKLKFTIQGGWDVVLTPGYWCGNANDSVNLTTTTYISKQDIPGTMKQLDLGVISRPDMRRIVKYFNKILSTKARVNPLSK